jgi:spermidine synthase
MKFTGAMAGLFLPLAALAAGEDFIEHYDTVYNSLTVQRSGPIVELRAKLRGLDGVESAVDATNPRRLVQPYTRTFHAGLFFAPKPERVLMLGLGGAGFHRAFAAARPDVLLQTVELDPKVYELSQTRMGFVPTANTPVALMDGRMFIKRNREYWDWLILDAFRGGYVPPHLKTQEFYRECAARLGERGVLISNLIPGSALYFSDLKTLQSVFPQIVLFRSSDKFNVIACAVNYAEPAIGDEATWPDAVELTAWLGGLVDMEKIRAERVPFPTEGMERAMVLTDDFAPVEFLDAINVNNMTQH